MSEFLSTAEPACIGSRGVSSADHGKVCDTAVESLRRASMCLLALSSIIAVVFAVVSGVKIDIAGAARTLWMLAAVLLASAMLGKSVARGRFSDCLAAQAIVGLGGLACAFISLAGLHLHFPRVDETLRQVDHATGLDGPAFAVWVSNSPTSAQMLLHAAYWLAAPVLVVSLLIQALRQQRLQLWRGAFCFIGGLLNVCLVSIVTPAKGVGVWLSEATIARLPAGAARYFWDAFDAFYEHKQSVLQIESIDGVVSFPSFHVVMGLITVSLWSGTPAMLVASLLWFLCMTAATVPIGGHYFIDVAAGAVVWSGWFVLSERLARG